MSYQLNQLEEVITKLIPATNGGTYCSTIERKLLSLSDQNYEGSEFQPSEISNQKHESSLELSKDLSTKIMNQEI